MGTQNYSIGRMQYLSKYRIGEENDCIFKNKFHIKDAEKEVVRFFLKQRTFTFKQNCSLDEMLKDENEEKLKEILLLHLYRIKYYTMMCIGNFIITSNKKLYNKSLIKTKEVQNFMMYLVDEKLLPKNVLILGHSPTNSFRSPYVVCPLIDKNHFDSICDMNGINLSDYDIINPKDRYPLTERGLNLYSLYQSYLDNVEVPYWYIEDFGYPVKTRQKAYYTTLFFD